MAHDHQIQSMSGAAQKPTHDSHWLRMLLRSALAASFVFALAAFPQIARAQTRTYEVKCPAGQTVLPGFESFDPLTGEWRQSVCIDLNGIIGMQINATNAAIKPAASDAVQCQGALGSDANDGLSCGAPKATLQAAMSSLPSTGTYPGGTVYMLGNQTLVLTSTLTIGSATENIVIHPMGRLTIQCNITNGAKCIDIFPGSGFRCEMSDVNNCVIDTFNSSTNVASLVATDTTATSQGLFLDGLDVRDSHSATIGTALVDYTNAFDAKTYSLFITPSVGEIGLYIHDASSSLCPNSDHFYGLTIQGGFPEFSGRPLVIKNDLGCSIGPIDVEGYDISHPASGNSNIEIDGGAHNFGVFSIHFAGGYEEDSGAAVSTPAMNLIKDASNITFVNSSQLRINASASEYAFQIQETAAEGPVSIVGDFANGGTGHNFVTNSVTGQNLKDNLSGGYFFPGNQTGFGQYSFDGGINLLSSGGGSILHQASNTAAAVTVTDPVATTLTPVVGTCTMTTTTCTITVVSGAAHCVATDSGGTIAGQCSIAGTTLTVTAASSNTSAWSVLWW